MYLVHGRDWGRLTDAVPAKSLAQIKTYYQNYKVRKEAWGNSEGWRCGQCVWGGSVGFSVGLQCGAAVGIRSVGSVGSSRLMCALAALMVAPSYVTPPFPPE